MGIILPLSSLNSISPHLQSSWKPSENHLMFSLPKISIYQCLDLRRIDFCNLLLITSWPRELHPGVNYSVDFLYLNAQNLLLSNMLPEYSRGRFVFGYLLFLICYFEWMVYWIFVYCWWSSFLSHILLTFYPICLRPRPATIVVWRFYPIILCNWCFIVDYLHANSWNSLILDALFRLRPSFQLFDQIWNLFNLKLHFAYFW